MKYLFNFGKFLITLKFVTFFCYGMEQEVTVDGYVCKRVGGFWFYSPELIEHKKQSYNHFPSLQYHPFSPIESQEVIEVNMGEIKTAVTGEAKILLTKKIFDCIGVIIRGPETVALGHVSYDPHQNYKSHKLLEEVISKLANPSTHEAFLATGYYSDNLDRVKTLLDNYNVSIKGVDVENAYVDYTSFISDKEWGFPSFHYATSKVREMQSQNGTAKEVGICAQTSSVLNKFSTN